MGTLLQELDVSPRKQDESASRNEDVELDDLETQKETDLIEEVRMLSSESESEDISLRDDESDLHSESLQDEAYEFGEENFAFAADEALPDDLGKPQAGEQSASRVTAATIKAHKSEDRSFELRDDDSSCEESLSPPRRRRSEPFASAVTDRL